MHNHQCVCGRCDRDRDAQLHRGCLPAACPLVCRGQPGPTRANQGLLLLLTSSSPPREPALATTHPLLLTHAPARRFRWACTDARIHDLRRALPSPPPHESSSSSLPTSSNERTRRWTTLRRLSSLVVGSIVVRRGRPVSSPPGGILAVRIIGSGVACAPDGTPSTSVASASVEMPSPDQRSPDDRFPEERSERSAARHPPPSRSGEGGWVSEAPRA